MTTRTLNLEDKTIALAITKFSEGILENLLRARRMRSEAEREMNEFAKTTLLASASESEKAAKEFQFALDDLNRKMEESIKLVRI
jgi:hypothetical protein